MKDCNDCGWNQGGPCVRSTKMRLSHPPCHISNRKMFKFPDCVSRIVITDVNKPVLTLFKHAIQQY